MIDHDKLNFGTMISQNEPTRPTVDQENELDQTGDRIKSIGRGFLIVVLSLFLLFLAIPVVFYSIDTPAAICLTILGICLLVLFGVILFQKLQNRKRSVIPSIAVVIVILYIVILLILTIQKH